MMNILNNLDKRWDALYWRQERSRSTSVYQAMKSRGNAKLKTLPDKPLNSIEEKELESLFALLEMIRPCALCRRSDEQEDILRMGEHWVHVDCGAEHHDAYYVDPTTKHIGESSADYKARMHREFPNFPN
jgi:hypothetical protein